MSEPEESATGKLFVVHTTGGEELRIKADAYVFDQNENKIDFFDAEGNQLKEWHVLLSGVAAIHVRPPGAWKVRAI